jgi:hypothetical protein
VQSESLAEERSVSGAIIAIIVGSAYILATLVAGVVAEYYLR